MPKSIGSIRIETDKILLRKEKTDKPCVKARKIIDIRGVRKLKRLPRKYMEGGDFLFYEKGSIKIGHLEPIPVEEQTEERKSKLVSEILLSPEAILPETDFQKIRRTIVKCGDRLHQINRHEKEMKSIENWKGRETLKI
jgi:hypothetical protein